MASLAAWAVHPWASPPALQWATWVDPAPRWVVLQAATWAVHPQDKWAVWAVWAARVVRWAALQAATWAAHPLDKWAAWLAQVDKSVAPVDPWAAWVDLEAKLAAHPMAK